MSIVEKICKCGTKFLRCGPAKLCWECVETHAKIQSVSSRIVLNAIKNGYIPRLPHDGISCVDCSKPAKVYDHRDYNFPLLVVPVCISCNLLRGHGENAIQALNKRCAGKGLTGAKSKAGGKKTAGKA